MNKLLSILVVSVFTLSGANALAADPPKDAGKKTEAALQKPADVSAEAWAKMTDAEKAKAVEKAKAMAAPATGATKKPKTGGC